MPVSYEFEQPGVARWGFAPHVFAHDEKLLSFMSYEFSGLEPPADRRTRGRFDLRFGVTYPCPNPLR
jgi:hypothetical protein